MKKHGYILICLLVWFSFYSCTKDDGETKVKSVSFLVDSVKLNQLDMEVYFNVQSLGQNDSVSIGFMYHNKEKYYDRNTPGVKEVLKSIRHSASHKVDWKSVPWNTTFYIYPFVKVGDVYATKNLHILKTNLPPIIQLIKPEQYQVTGSLKPRFEWENLGDTSILYQVHLKLDTDKDYKKVAELKNFTAYSPKENLLQDRIYIWKVIAVDQTGKTLTQSFDRPFSSSKRVEVVYPTKSLLKVPILPTFIWKLPEAVERGSLSYELQIKELGASKWSTYGNISNVEIIQLLQQGVKVVSHPLRQSLRPGISYQYRIILYLNEIYAGQSSEEIFRTINQVYLKTPANGAKAVEIYPTYDWDAVSSSQQTFKYQLFVSTSPQLGDEHKVGEFAQGTEFFQTKTPLLSNTQYYWKVKAVPLISPDDSPPQAIAESEIRTFSTLSPIKTYAPKIHASVTETSVLLSWEPEPKGLPRDYFYQYYLGENIRSLTVKKNANNKEIKIFQSQYEDVDISPGKTYYYKISLVGPEGGISESKIESFQTPRIKALIIGGDKDQAISKIRSSQGDLYVALDFDGALDGPFWKDVPTPSGKKNSLLFRITPTLDDIKYKWMLQGIGSQRFKVLASLDGGLAFGWIYDDLSQITKLDARGITTPKPIGYDISVGVILNRDILWNQSLIGTEDDPYKILRHIYDQKDIIDPKTGKISDEAQDIANTQYLLRHDNITDIVNAKGQSALYVSGKFFQKISSGAASAGEGQGSKGLETGFIAKFSQVGATLWLKAVKQSYSSDKSTIQALSYHQEVGLLCLLNYEGEVNLYPTSSTQPEKKLASVAQNSALLILDGNGNLINHYPLLSSGSMETRNMVIDDQSNAYISANFSNTIQLRGGDISMSATGAQDILLMKINTKTGKILWAINIESSNVSNSTDMAIDEANQSILLSGTYRSSLSAFSSTITSKGDQDGFACRVSYDGVLMGIKSWGGVGKDEITTIQPYDKDHALVGGSFQLQSELVSGKVQSLGGKDAFLEIVKL